MKNIIKAVFFILIFGIKTYSQAISIGGGFLYKLPAKNYKDGWGGEGHLNYSFNNFLSIETSIGVIELPTKGETLLKGTIKEVSYNLLVLYKYNFGPIDPYAGLGVGLINESLKIDSVENVQLNNMGIAETQSFKLTPGYTGLLGIEFGSLKIPNLIHFFIEARYTLINIKLRTKLQAINFDASSQSDSNIELSNESIVLGAILYL